MNCKTSTMWHIIFCLLLTGVSPTFDVQTLDGRIVSGSLAELTADRLTVETDSGKVFLETEKLLDVSLKHKPAASAQPPGAWIELTDGSTIVARQYTVRGDRAVITLLDDEVLETPTRSIRNVRLQHVSEAMTDQWSQILTNKLDGDVLVVRKGDNLDYHQGVLGDINAEVVRFQLDGEDLPINRAKVYGLAYRHPSGEAQSGPICRLTDIFGSHWQVSKIALEKKLQLTTPSGLAFSCSPEIVGFDRLLSGQNCVSQRSKAGIRGLDAFFQHCENPALVGTILRSSPGSEFRIQSAATGRNGIQQGTCDPQPDGDGLPTAGSFTRLKAVAGIDDSVRPQGNVRLVIRGDNKVLLDMPIAGTDEPKPIDLDICRRAEVEHSGRFRQPGGFRRSTSICATRES